MSPNTPAAAINLAIRTGACCVMALFVPPPALPFVPGTWSTEVPESLLSPALLAVPGTWSCGQPTSVAAAILSVLVTCYGTGTTAVVLEQRQLLSTHGKGGTTTLSMLRSDCTYMQTLQHQLIVMLPDRPTSDKRCCDLLLACTASTTCVGTQMQ